MEELKEAEVMYIEEGIAYCPYCGAYTIYNIKQEKDNGKRYKTTTNCKYCGKPFLLTNVKNGLLE